MIVASQLLADFKDAQLAQDDTNLVVPNVIVPTISLQGPFGNFVFTTVAGALAQNTVFSQTTQFRHEDSRTNQAGTSVRWAGLDKGVWDLSFAMYAETSTAQANRRLFTVQHSFDQSVFLALFNFAVFTALGSTINYNLNIRVALLQQWFLNFSYPTVGVGETITTGLTLVANRLQ